LAELIDAYALPSFTFDPWRRAATPERIKKAFADCGIFPLNRDIVLSSPNMATSVPFHDPSKTSAVSNRLQPPLPASPSVLADLLQASKPESGFTLRDLTSRSIQPFLHHFLSINSHLTLGWFNDYARNIANAGLDAEPAPLFDDPIGPTGPSFVVPLIGESVHDVLNTNNPEQMAKITSARNKRKRVGAIDMRTGGLLTTDTIVDKLFEQEKGSNLFIHIPT